MQSTKFTSVDEYIASFPPATRKLLREIRAIIKNTAPKAQESISYNMPAYKQNGPLVYFAGYTNHIGFYPTGSGIKAFEKQLAKYATSKGTIRLPLDEPLPVRLISAIVKHRIEMNELKAKAKM